MGVARGFEAAHRSFALSRRLVRVFRTIIQAFVLSVLDAHEDLALGCTIAGKFVGDDHPWYILAALQEVAEKRFGCRLVSSALNKDIEHVSVLVNRSPEVCCFALDGQKHFVDVPRIAWLRTSTPKRIGILLPELARPRRTVS